MSSRSKKAANVKVNDVSVGKLMLPEFPFLDGPTMWNVIMSMVGGQKVYFKTDTSNTPLPEPFNGLTMMETFHTKPQNKSGLDMRTDVSKWWLLEFKVPRKHNNRKSLMSIKGEFMIDEKEQKKGGRFHIMSFELAMFNWLNPVIDFIKWEKTDLATVLNKALKNRSEGNRILYSTPIAESCPKIVAWDFSDGMEWTRPMERSSEGIDVEFKHFESVKYRTILVISGTDIGWTLKDAIVNIAIKF